MSEPLMRFGERLIAFRDRKKFNQRDFAKHIGYSQAYQCDLEHGRRGPSVAYVNAFLEAFNVHPVERRRWHRWAVTGLGWQIDSRL